MVIVWWGRWGCCRCCLRGCRRGSRGRWRGCSGGGSGCGLGVFSSLPSPLAMLYQAQELQGALSFPVWTLSPTTFIASFTAQVVLAADSDPSPEALHDSTVHSRGDWAPSKEPRPRGPPQPSCGGLWGRCVPHLTGHNAASGMVRWKEATAGYCRQICFWQCELSVQGHMNRGLQRLGGEPWRRCGGGELVKRGLGDRTETNRRGLVGNKPLSTYSNCIWQLSRSWTELVGFFLPHHTDKSD